MKRTALMAALLGAATLTTPALAQMAATEGGFMGASVMSSNTDSAGNYGDSTGAVGESKTTGGKLFGGYMWGNWGVELGAYQLGIWEVKTAAGNKTAQFESQAVSLSGVYMAPIGQSGVVNLKAGAAQVSTEFTCRSACVGATKAEKTSTVLLLGAGLGWRLTPAFMLRMDYERFSEVDYNNGTGIQSSPVEVLSLGLQINF